MTHQPAVVLAAAGSSGSSSAGNRGVGPAGSGTGRQKQSNNDTQQQQQQQQQKQATADGGGPANINSIFVPLLPQPNEESQSPSSSSSSDRQQSSARRSQDVEKMFDNSRRPPWIRRTVWLTALLALLLFTGSFALFDSLLDDSESEQSNGQSQGNDDELSSEDAKHYLDRFGYISVPQADQPANADQRLLLQAQPAATSGHRTADVLLEDFSMDLLKSAIRRFQDFAGLPPTGELDNRTRKKMKQPRCGMQDVEMLRGRGADNVLKWRKRQLTYRVDHFSADLPQYMQKKALQMAFDAWSRHVPLEFSESGGGGQADIRVRFARGSHGDPWPFDGRGGVLAHATFPTDGQLHFDDDEHWAFMDGAKIASFRYTDLFWVSLHEIGHVLGLSHSKEETAIMAPFYRDPEDMVDWRGNYKTPELTQDDIRAAQQIYGSKRNGATADTGSSRRTGVGRNTGSAGRGGHYDDSEGGFLSQLGKFLSGESDSEDGAGTADADDHGWTRGGGGERRRHRNEAEDDADDDGGVFGSFFSSSSPAIQPSSILLVFLTFLAAIYAAGH